MLKITIKELHERTGAHVRRAGKAPIQVTDRGRLVAVLAAPEAVATGRRKRTLLPEYERLLARGIRGDSAADLAAVRGER